MTARIRDMAKGLASLGGLLLILIGPPLALAHFVGWPLPRTVPSVDEVATAARSGVDDMVVLKVLAVLAWLCWAQIALAAMVEVAAVARGRAARRAPVVAAVQMGVGRLVATAALVVASLGPQRSGGAPLPVARLAALVAEPALMGPAPQTAPLTTPRLVARAQDGTRPDEPSRFYVVQRNDSWWSIAEETFGEGQRWKELRTANLGRTMPDGTVIDSGSELIRPGWKLVVPEPQPPAPVTASTGEVDEIEVQAGDHLWGMAEGHVQEVTGGTPSEADIRGHWQTAIDMNRDRFADPDNPSLIYPGQRMRMPSVGRAAGSAVPASEEVNPAPPEPPPSVPASAPIPIRPDLAPTTATMATTAPPTTVRLSVPSAQPTATPAQPGSSAAKGGVPAGVLGTASTVLSVGIAAALVRRRRSRQLRLPSRTQPPTPPPELDDLRASMVVNGDVDQVTKLHRAMRDISAALGSRRSDARPRLIQVAGGRIEVLLTHAELSPPKPWRAEASGMSWELRGEPLDRDEDGVAPIPALVSLGRPDANTELYLDLEAEGVVSLVGSPDEVAGVARSWVLELATSPMAAGVSVIVLGESLAPAESTSDRIREVTAWEEAATDALAWCEQSAAVLEANRWPSPVIGRLRAERADDLAPLVVFSQGVASDRLRGLAAAILDQQASVILVAIGTAMDGALAVEASEGNLAIPSLGLVCEAQTVSLAAAGQVDELLEDASRPPTQLSLVSQPLRTVPATVELRDDEYRDPAFEILVRLLGDISVVGAPRSLKPKQVAVLAYIALHAPVASDRVEDALWVTATASRRKRLANTVSEIRSVLGAANLPISVDGRYRVGPGVVTDVDLFDRRLEHGAQQDDVAAAATLRGALELVQGPVFTYRNVDRMSYVWVDIDNWISTWELKVTDTAEELAQRYLDLGDSQSAVWAARRGLKACQTHVRLTQLLMQAHIVGGDRMAAERVRQSYRGAMEKLELDEGGDDIPDLCVEGLHGG